MQSNILEEAAEEDFDDGHDISEKNPHQNAHLAFGAALNQSNSFGIHDLQHVIQRQIRGEEGKLPGDQAIYLNDWHLVDQVVAQPGGTSPERLQLPPTISQTPEKEASHDPSLDVDMTTVKKKETMIIQRQIMINTQMGLTPISPQSYNLLEIGGGSRAQQVQETSQAP